MAKLTVTIPKPVEVFNGDRNKPNDCRIPIVTARIAAAEITSVQNVRCAVIRSSLIELNESLHQLDPYIGLGLV